ncbi:hypothetical protein ECG_00760 [Echinococcus granulosus]|uniref:Uncharacterized protein n=1 Tax=Echinococcus granulosus TaxID=6210 RepID=A0A068WD93_ECHGR|nr:hypothetical protein ECG_00760 [Echinococcus granulosus]CDS16376.1 hypothetical protein EgrG_002019200 [Echinococcus granulosus]
MNTFKAHPYLTSDSQLCRLIVLVKFYRRTESAQRLIGLLCKERITFDLEAPTNAGLSESNLDGLHQRPSLKFHEFALFEAGIATACSVSTGKLRSFIPESFLRNIFKHLHLLPHPSTNANSKLICDG